MRYYNQGSGFRVSFSARDAKDFSDSWPCSTVEGPGWFEYDSGGDFVDRSEWEDGEEWAAFSADCQAYGESKHRERKGAL